MKKKTLLVVALILILAVFFVVKRKRELARAPVFGEKPVLVSVFRAQKKDIKNLKEYLAKVEPINEATVSPRINARVEKVLVDEGSKVKKGGLLAKLDRRDILANLNKAKKELYAAQENYDYWNKECIRDQNLFDQGAISEEERDKTKNNFAQAQARLKSAQESIDFYMANLSYAAIISPYPGVVSKRFVDEGDLATVGKPLFIVEDRNQLKLSFDIPQEDISSLSKGNSVFYQANGKAKEAKITNIFPSLEEGRVLHIEAYLEGKGKLSVGSFIPIKVLVAEKEGAVVIPKSSVYRMDSLNPFVFLVKDKKLKKSPVKLGMESDELLEAKNLKEGEVVVRSPYLSWTTLSDGLPVKVMDEE